MVFERIYYKLTDLMARWSVTEDILLQWAEAGHLHISAKVRFMLKGGTYYKDYTRICPSSIDLFTKFEGVHISEFFDKDGQSLFVMEKRTIRGGGGFVSWGEREPAWERTTEERSTVFVKKTDLVVMAEEVARLDPELLPIGRKQKISTVDPREEKTDLNIIFVLKQLLTRKDGKNNFQSQAQLIETMENMYGTLLGISKPTLEQRFAAANKANKMQNGDE